MSKIVESYATEIYQRRQALDEAEDKLLTAREADEFERAAAVQRVIDVWNGDEKAVLGANDEARKRAVILLLADDVRYLEAHRTLREAEAAVARLASELEFWRDRRRQAEWRIRKQLAAGLDGSAAALAITNLGL